MTNTVFDLNNMFMRSLFIIGGFGSKSYTFDNQNEIDQLMRKISTDISFIIRQTNSSRSIFTMDERSWRKNIEIEENEGYKGQREKSGHINWDNVFNTMNEFSSILESNGFIVSKVKDAEADDLMALWRDELLYNQHQHVILVSSDEDIRQLITSFPYTDNKSVYSTVFNPFKSGRGSQKRLYIPIGFEKWLNSDDEGDIFNRSIDVDKEDFLRLKETEKIDFEYVDGDEIALRKVFCGDGGDNIPAIYSWIVEKNGETVLDTNGEPKLNRITPSKYKKIVENLNIKSVEDLVDKSELISKELESISGIKPPFNVLNRIKRQLKLVVLNSKYFPEEIVETFNNELDENLNKAKVQAQNWNMNSLLEGTRYIRAKGQKNTGAEASIFGDIDKMTNKKLF